MSGGPPQKNLPRVPTGKRLGTDDSPRGSPLPVIGRADLDPFAGGRGGGMVFDPMRASPVDERPNLHNGFQCKVGPGVPQELPKPSPPRARFDPFGPPELDESGNVKTSKKSPQAKKPTPHHAPKPGFQSLPPKPGFL